MKQAEIDAIKARCEKADPGPWKGRPQDAHAQDFWWEVENAERRIFSVELYDAHNAEFIAASRSDVPRLLEEVGRLRGLLALAAQTMRGVGIQDDEWVKPRYQQILEALGE